MWNLDDVMTWICSLEPSGAFHKYKDNLRKLKYLEEPAHGKSRSKKDVQFGNRLRKFKGKQPRAHNGGSPLSAEMLLNRLHDGDRESDEYDDRHSVDDSKCPLDAAASKESTDPPDTDEGGGNGDGHGDGDVEGQHEATSGLSAESGDDDGDGLVAIADPQSATPRDDHRALNGHDIALQIAASMKALKSNEGQYHVQYSDSEQSNNDKHGANEVVFQALMPQKSSDEEEDDPVLKSIDVEKLLDTMDNEILSNLVDDVHRRGGDQMGDLRRAHPDKAGHRNKARSTALRGHFDGDDGVGDSGSTTSSSPALSDESYSGPDEPILESINSTVLKMCGIRSAEDRKVMMFHIESLRNGQFSPYHESAEEVEAEVEEAVEDDVVGDALRTQSGHDDDGGGQQQPEAEEVAEHPEWGTDDGNTEISTMDEEDSGEDDPDRTLAEYQCPITKQLMSDPVICSDGHSYERRAIEDWLLHHEASPMTDAPLTTKQLFPNHSLRSMIAEYRQQLEVKAVSD